MGKLLEIFRSGRQTSSSGQQLEFTSELLADTVAAYNPALHEAPLVVGHPRDNDPAWGWVKSIVFKDGSLQAEISQVDPQFQEQVEAGRYKKISASFYTPESASNPVPGVFYLRHVGFLGAMPPAVKGLRAIAFSEDEGAIEFEIYTEESNMADQEALEARSRALEEQEAKLKKLTADFSEQKKKLQEKEDAIATQQKALNIKQRQLQFSETLDKLIQEGKVLAADKDHHLRQLQLLASVDKGEVTNFIEDKNFDPVKDYLKRLQAQPKKVEFGEITGQAPKDPSDYQAYEVAAGIQKIMREAEANGTTMQFSEAQHLLMNGGN